MKRLLPLLVLVAIPAPSVALADGCPPSSCGVTSTAQPGSNIVLVRPNGPLGPLRAYDVSTGARRFSLPRGVLSSDGSTFISAVAPAPRAKRTTVARHDARSGKLLRSWSLPGRWNTAALSADGSRHLLLRYSRTGISLRGAGSRTALRGMFEVEALSPDGRKVFLVHWQRNGGYVLQHLDLATQRLAPTRLDEPDEKMSGTATTAVATRDGKWLLTLYSKADGHSFVHALNLLTGVAHCIDLTLKGDFMTVGSTALVLSPDERTLYLASPYLGRVITVDLATLEVRRVVRFRGLPPETIDVTVGPSGAGDCERKDACFQRRQRVVAVRHRVRCPPARSDRRLDDQGARIPA